ncbi:hypothetical protein ACH40F_37390 [Streptomyces sp. NPDC020794]|uniref:hypothetical protein n=1 Tax=unclassified Streptomyces TaxID=2593676 RepID=UPI0036F18A27
MADERPIVGRDAELAELSRLAASPDGRALLLRGEAGVGKSVMTSRQDVAMAGLNTGRAAVFTDGEDAPLLVQVPHIKGGSGSWPTDTEVREHMRGQGMRPMPASGDCDAGCLTDPAACQAARSIVDDPGALRTFARTVLSAVQTPNSLVRTWPDVLAMVSPRLPAGMDVPAALRRFARHASRRLADTRGARASWSYSETATVADLIGRAVGAHVNGEPTDDAVEELRRTLLALQGGGYGPFQDCGRIWAERPGPCLCRGPVAELVATSQATRGPRTGTRPRRLKRSLRKAAEAVHTRAPVRFGQARLRLLQGSQGRRPPLSVGEPQAGDDAAPAQDGLLRLTCSSSRWDQGQTGRE